MGASSYTGEMFSEWKGNLFFVGLSSKALIRLALDEDRLAVEERIDMGRRIRDVIEGPDGAILVLVDAKDGELLRISPAK